jgi:hypothetical protein
MVNLHSPRRRGAPCASTRPHLSDPTPLPATRAARSLIGTIPPEFGAVPRMRRFQVEHNRLRGPIPQSFK